MLLGGKKTMTFDLNLEGREGIKVPEVKSWHGWPKGQCEHRCGRRVAIKVNYALHMGGAIVICQPLSLFFLLLFLTQGLTV